jgi:hypothetical protein
MLAARNFVKAESILQDHGCGAADAVSINMTCLKQEGDRMFHNIEVAPAIPPALESTMSVLNISPREHIYHCNKYVISSLPTIIIYHQFRRFWPKLWLIHYDNKNQGFTRFICDT